MNQISKAIDFWTRATHEDQIKSLISLGGLPSRETAMQEIDKAAYYVALEGVTKYGLSEAVRSIIRGTLGHTFFPSPVELRFQCDKAMEPHYREADRIRRQETQAKENAEFRRVIASRTPEAKARQQAAYARFCEQHQASKPVSPEPTVYLDPDLVAQVPDAPTPFKRAKVA